MLSDLVRFWKWFRCQHPFEDRYVLHEYDEGFAFQFCTACGRAIVKRGTERIGTNQVQPPAEKKC